MEKPTTIVNSGGSSFMGLLFIVFLVLKLTGTITWSWWWVTAPLWGGFVLLLAILLLVGIVFGIIGLVAWATNS